MAPLGSIFGNKTLLLVLFQLGEALKHKRVGGRNSRCRSRIFRIFGADISPELVNGREDAAGIVSVAAIVVTLWMTFECDKKSRSFLFS